MTKNRARATTVFGYLSVLSAVACSEPSPRDTFETEVVPVIERYCAGSSCHGVAQDAERAGDVIDWHFFNVRINADGTLADVDAAYASAKARINTTEHAALSSLLRKPLAAEADGLVHAGGVQFPNVDAPGYETLRAWIAAETDGGEGESYGALDPEQQFFAQEVQPHLATRQCLNSACHGAFSPFTQFEAPVRADGEPVFSVAATRNNYQAARMHLFLGGAPAQSRLLRKVLPRHDGGIAHRGRNNVFSSPSSQGAQAILDWAELEQLSAMGEAKIEPSAIVFVRGPIAASRPFEHDGFVAGTDLYVLEPPEPGGSLRNLTAIAHDSPADVRDPAVSHDGSKVAFAMRLAAADAFNIYEIGVDGSGLRQVTHDVGPLPGGGLVASVQPTYGPDGRIFFVSTRAGTLADGYDGLDTEVWAVDPDTGALERLTYDPSPAVTPHFIPTGKNYGTLSFTMRRTIGGRYEAPVFRFPLDHNKAYHSDPEIHVHHGITAVEDIVYGMRTLPDGRQSCVLLDRNNQWRGGRLAIFDRQLGPEIARGQESQAAIGGFLHAYSILSDDSVSAGGESPGGLYRHPVALPDGRLLVSHAPGPIDLDDASAAPEMGLQLIELIENPETGATELGQVTVLIDEPGVAEFDAELVVRRPLEDDPDHGHDWDFERIGNTGVVSFRHVETLESIFSNLSQAGSKVLREDLAFVRFVEAIGVTPAEQAAAPVGLSVHGRNRVLGELPLLGGSVYVELPADTPFRVQYLNSERMAVGAQHNRWNQVAPGEKFPGGVAPVLYPTLCAGCHGTLSGNPNDMGGPIPDVITSASLTEATHVNMNVRRPREPVPIGAAPITVDFSRDVAPLFARSCAKAGCHAATAPAAGLVLEPTPTSQFDAAYEAIMRPGDGSAGGSEYVDASGSSARRSYLIERVYGRELDARRSLDGECKGDPALSEDERLMLVRWIELGASYRGEAP